MKTEGRVEMYHHTVASALNGGDINFTTLGLPPQRSTRCQSGGPQSRYGCCAEGREVAHGTV
jgi:hypothetical protein